MYKKITLGISKFGKTIAFKALVIYGITKMIEANTELSIVL